MMFLGQAQPDSFIPSKGATVSGTERQGPVAALNTAASSPASPARPRIWPAGRIERLAILLPFLAAVLLFLFGLFDLAIALLLLSGVIASTGWSVRKQQAQRRPPS